ncbi:holo-ACP synthase [Sediminibacillus albus]|uniref:Holo-[acyl-carrier-protein] synthase n=1 Tax=Sediminibacillus albus TaxID=407036 RepID=A0A1G9AUX1_9BACI|nr:holo-ACP synthase [Sediminibacillus albus]SDK31072.1 holo-[acyl-carrier protein] synthase [Sediminibacillus albus]
MILGIGIDIIELERMKKSIDGNRRLVKRVLTEKEQEVFFRLKSDARQVEFLAGRFAAKEAYAKALGTGLGKLSFQDIEIIADEKGAPKIKVEQLPQYKVFLSISHSQDYAVAQVVIEA